MDKIPRADRAFLSYRHADNVEAGRQWATWLHHRIETYEVPADLVGRPGADGAPTLERISPVFRDGEELPIDVDLASPIYRPLGGDPAPRSGLELSPFADAVPWFPDLAEAIGGLCLDPRSNLVPVADRLAGLLRLLPERARFDDRARRGAMR